jgi:hypothetical protein
VVETRGTVRALSEKPSRPAASSLTIQFDHPV